jgi:hypothetical protein
MTWLGKGMIWIAGTEKEKIIVNNILRDTLRLPADGLRPLHTSAD